MSCHARTTEKERKHYCTAEMPTSTPRRITFKRQPLLELREEPKRQNLLPSRTKKEKEKQLIKVSPTAETTNTGDSVLRTAN
jgi:hypothetical protein